MVARKATDSGVQLIFIIIIALLLKNKVFNNLNDQKWLIE